MAEGGRPRRLYGGEGRSRRLRAGRLSRLADRLPAAPRSLSLDEGFVFADQQLEVRAFFVGELEEDPLAFGVLEPFAVALEELVRPALAANADHQRLPIVDALGELLGAGGEQSVGGAFEKEERRPRLELRILLQQLLVARAPACRGAPSPLRRASRTPGGRARRA